MSSAATQPSSPGNTDDAKASAAIQKLKQNENDLRKRILAIQQDTSIPAAEKAKRIQQLMSGQAQKQQKSSTSRSIVQYNKYGEIRQEEKCPSWHDEENKVFGCKHYMRSVKLQSHCCGKWVVCRFCHDEVSDHAIVRQKTKLMMCMKCFHVQPCSQFCTNPECNAKVSRYYCNECKLWDDDPKKNIYHCYDCGICRIGKGLGQDYFHCKKCNVCMAISLKDKHKCIERNLESDCPICGEYMFTSTTTVIFMPCGHCIHHKCYQEHIQNSYTCPTCCKSLGNMTEYFNRIDQALAQHRMPPEYEDMLSFVFCNDCEKRSKAKYHFVYHKCGKCGSYNTKILSTLKKGSNDEAVVDEKLAKWDAEAKACASGAGSPSCSSPICNSNSSSVSNLQSPSSPTTSTTSLSSGSPMPINQERRNSETTSSTTTFISNPLNGSTDLPGSYPNGTLPTSTSQTSPSRTN